MPQAALQQTPLRRMRHLRPRCRPRLTHRASQRIEMEDSSSSQRSQGWQRRALLPQDATCRARRQHLGCTRRHRERTRGHTTETPRETLEGIAPNRNSSSTAGSASSSSSSWLSKTNTAATGASIAAAATRASSLFSAFSGSTEDAGTGSSTPTSSRPSTAVGGGSQPFDLTSTSSNAGSPTSENNTRSKILAANANKKGVKRTTSTGGTGPTGAGRYAKVKGDLHLLSGNLWEALERYTAALHYLGKERALAGGQDAVWFASALEGFSVARVLVSRMGGVVLEKAPCFDLLGPQQQPRRKTRTRKRTRTAFPVPTPSRAGARSLKPTQSPLSSTPSVSRHLAWFLAQQSR